MVFKTDKQYLNDIFHLLDNPLIFEVYNLDDLIEYYFRDKRGLKVLKKYRPLIEEYINSKDKAS